MWSLSFAIYLGCKWLTWRRTPTTASIGRKFGYLFAWPGLDAAAFLHSSDDVAISRPDAKEWSLASLKLLCGVSLIWGVVRLIPTDSPYAAGWVGMIGLVMTLHFGIFHLLSCTWRTFGVNAPPLMDWPIASVSVSEFWGRRWNRAFRDLTHRFLFRPLTAKLGPRWALVVGFLFSGLVHDAVISYPAGGGYGGPTLFFMLQAAAMFVERSPRGRREGYGRGMKGRLFTIAVLITPVTLLFHRPFVLTIIVPFLEAMRVF
ncbi:MAG: MBOAT family protein [Planctomycetota bacterium]|nr:MBOAT family protein [Planctomycetota bacterium]MDA1212644.1 MBOAT family protein [Planctomycetota bacterium]